MGNAELKQVGAILDELFQFDGQIEELCTESEMQGEFPMSATDMIATLRAFVEHTKSLKP